jgi:hypothetical protein
MRPMDKVTGDPAGIEALKALVHEHRDYLKFLLNEARTATDHTASFTTADGRKFRIRIDGAHDRIEVLAAE